VFKCRVVCGECLWFFTCVWMNVVCVCVCVCADVVCVRLCRDGEGILGGAGAQGGAEAEFAPAARGRHVCGAGEQQGEPWLSLILLSSL